MKVLTIGTFDVPHIGHAAFLAASARHGELTVGINSDPFVETYRGKPAIFSQHERKAYIGDLGYRTVINESPGRELIWELQPDLLTIGADWLGRDYLHQIDMTDGDFAALGLSLLYVHHPLSRLHSTELVERIRS